MFSSYGQSDLCIEQPCFSELLDTTSEHQENHMKQQVAAYDTILLFTDMGLFNFNSGKLDLAEECFSHALSLVDGNGKCGIIKEEGNFIDRKEAKIMNQIDRSSTTSLSNSFLQSSGEIDEGMQVYSEPLHIDQANIVELVRSTLLYNVAQTYVHNGKYQGAYQWFQKSLMSCPKTTSDHIASIILRIKIFHNLGYCNYVIGRHDDAMKSYKNALSLANELEFEGIEWAVSMHCVGILHFYEESMDRQAIIDMFRKCIVSYSQNDPSDILYIATIWNNIGRVQYQEKKYKDALTTYKEALKMRLQVMGRNSIDVAGTIFNMGQTHHQLGDMEACDYCYDTSLKMAKSYAERSDSKRRSKPKLVVASFYIQIAEIHLELANPIRARHFLNQALFSQETSPSSSSGNFDDATILPILQKLGQVCFANDDYADAVKYYKRGLKIEETIFRPNHPLILTTLKNIAHSYKALGDTYEAHILYNHVRETQIKTFGPNSLEAAATLHSIGSLHYQTGNLNSAFDCYQEVLRVRCEVYEDKDHVDIASTLNDIGVVVFKNEDFVVAQKFFNDSLRIGRKTLGDDHLLVAMVCFNLGSLYIAVDEAEKAIHFYKESHRINKKLLGPDHSYVGLSLHSIGQILQVLGRPDEALEYFEDALMIERNREIRCWKSFAGCLNTIGKCHWQKGDIDRMMDSFILAIRIYESIFGEQLLGEDLNSEYIINVMKKLHPPCAPQA